MRRLNPVICALSLLALVACSKPFKATIPNGFVELEDTDDSAYDFRAAHPDGLVVSVRVLDNKPKGSLEFWSRAIENQLRQVKGYRLIVRSALKNAQGIEGCILKFGHDEGKSPHLYRVAVFLKEDHLFVLELGGTSPLVAAHEAELAHFVDNFTMN